MTAKEYLSQLKDYEDRIRASSDALARTEAALYSLTGIDYTKDRVQTSPDADAGLAEKVGRVSAIQEELDALVTEQTELRLKILSQLNAMDTYVYRSLLYRRYAEYKQLEDIADEMSYSYGYVRQLHGDALQEFERLYLSEKT